ncbi:MAG: hypothetical protein AAGI13_01155 [Pseudomonadota bacterium]
MANYLKTLIEQPDWFGPVRHSAQCRYLGWRRERFSFAISLTDDSGNQLENNRVLDIKPWAPAVKIYDEALRAVARDTQASEQKFAAMIAAFEIDQDWTRLILACRAEKDAFAQKAKAALTKAEVKMQAAAARIWAVESRKDPALAQAGFEAVIAEDVHPGSVTLDLGRLELHRSTDIAPWQEATKRAVKSCLDLARQGRALEAAETALTGALETDGNEASPALAAYGQAIVTLETAEAATESALGVAEAAASRALDGCRFKKLSETLGQSGTELAALTALTGRAAARCLAAKRAADQVEATLRVPAGEPADPADPLAAMAVLDRAAEGGQDLWEDLSKSATKAMNAVVKAGQIASRHASQLRSKPEGIDVEIVS